MTNWLDRFFPQDPTLVKRHRDRPNLPSLDVRFWDEMSQQRGGLPNASVVYGGGAAALFVLSVYSLFTGSWLTGLLLLLPAGAFLGFALYFIKHPH